MRSAISLEIEIWHLLLVGKSSMHIPLLRLLRKRRQGRSRRVVSVRDMDENEEGKTEMETTRK
jgi:hypothetical protein